AAVDARHGAIVDGEAVDLEDPTPATLRARLRRHLAVLAPEWLPAPARARALGRRRRRRVSHPAPQRPARAPALSENVRGAARHGPPGRHPAVASVGWKEGVSMPPSSAPRSRA